MNRRYISLTGISSILTAHILPVSAQSAQAPLPVHFVPPAHGVDGTQTLMHQQHMHQQSTDQQVMMHHQFIHQQNVDHQNMVQQQQNQVQQQNLIQPTHTVTPPATSAALMAPPVTTPHVHTMADPSSTHLMHHMMHMMHSLPAGQDVSGGSFNHQHTVSTQAPVMTPTATPTHSMPVATGTTPGSFHQAQDIQTGGWQHFGGWHNHAASTGQPSSINGFATQGASQPTAHHQGDAATNAASGLLGFFHHQHHNAALNTANAAGMQQQNLSNHLAVGTMPAIQSQMASPGHHLIWQNNLPSTSPKTINLDLASSAQSTTLGHQLNNLSVMINVGGAQLLVNSSTQLTAAEKVAALQVVSTGSQSLMLDAKGTADGGSMTITPWLAQHLGNLVIPQGVSVSDVSKTGTLVLKGSLTDSGNLYVTSANPNATAVSLNAANITVNSGGLLSNFQTGTTSPLDFNINSSGSILNAGSIVSAGGLALSAVGAVSNSASSASLPQPVIHALNDVTITSGAGAITNSGVVSSQNGGIKLATTQPETNLVVNANGGTFQASHGAITIRDASYSGAGNTTLTGGNYLAPQLNIYSGTGDIEGNVGQVSGNLSTTAQIEHFIAATNTLTLANNTVSGDPTFANTGGNILISGVNTFGENVAILASGNITSDATGSIVDHGNTVYLVAGAGLSVNSGSFSQPGGTTISGATSTPSVQLSAGQTVTVNFSTAASGATPGGTGGNIDLSASNAPVIIDTTSAVGNGNGGNVTLAAFANGITGGEVLLNQASSINSYGNGTGLGGNVNIYAGANPATAATTISTGSITTGGAGPGGNSANNGAINIFTAQPTSTTGTTVSFDNTGTIGAQSITNSATISAQAGVSTQGLLSAGAGAASQNFQSPGGVGGNITVNSGNYISTTFIRSFGGGGGGVFGADSAASSAGGNGGNISLQTGAGGISTAGDINTSGGGGGGAASPSTGGNAGNVSITSQGTIQISGPVLAAGGGFGGTESASLHDNGGGPGGGSFGGGGGAGQVLSFAGGGGGGGFTGGGGAGGGDQSNFQGGGGSGAGGGGFATGGGGGGGTQGTDFFGSFYPGAGGGGGGGIGTGGGGGGISNAQSVTGAGNTGGGAGGGGGGNGGTGVIIGAARPGNGGSGGSGGGGNGSNGPSVNPPFNGGTGGDGGNGGGVGGGTASGGSGDAGTGGTGGVFGQPGGVSTGGGVTAGGAVGSSGAGGQVTISGVGSVTISGTITSLANTYGFNSATLQAQAYANDSINAAGTGGKITVSVTSPSLSSAYLADANYSQGAATYLAPVGGLTIAGNLRTTTANSITLNGTVSPGTSVTGPISSGGVTGTILEGTKTVTIGPNTMVTPAEYIAFVEAKNGGQTLVLSQGTVGDTNPGTGYASGGDFTVATANIPGSGFTNLILPTNVTEIVTAPSVNYSGTATVNGTVNFTSATGGTFSSGGSMTGSGLIETTGGTSAQLTLSTTNGSIGSGTAFNTNTSILSATAGGAGNSVNISNTGQVALVTSGAQNTFTLQNSSFISIDGDVNSAASPGGTINLIANGGPTGIGDITGTLHATNVKLTTNGPIGDVLNAIKVQSPSVTVSSGADVYVTDSSSASVATAGAGVGSLTFTDTAAAGVLTIPAAGITSSGLVSLITTQSGSKIDVQGPVTSTNAGITLSSQGTITASSTGILTAQSGSGSVSLTANGDIGANSGPGTLLLKTPQVHLDTNGVGDVYVSDSQATTVDTNFSSSVHSLVFTDSGFVSNSVPSLTVLNPGIRGSGDITLITNNGPAGILISGPVTSGVANTIKINANMAGTISGTGTLTGDHIQLTTGGGDIGSSSGSVNTNATDVTVATNSTGDAYLNEVNGGFIYTGTGSAGSVHNLTATNSGVGSYLIAGNATAGQSINATGNVNLSATNVGLGYGGIDIEGDINASAGSITLTATGTTAPTFLGITENRLGFGTGTLTAGLVDLRTGAGDIGQSGNEVLTSTPILKVATNGSGDVFVKDAISVTVENGFGSVKGLAVTETGVNQTLHTDIGGLIANGNVTLQGDNGSSVSVDGNLQAAGQTISLITTGASGSIQGAGQITADTVKLETGGGGIGQASPGFPMRLVAPNVYVASGSTGAAYVADNIASATITTGSDAAGKVGSLSFLNAGDIVVGSAGIHSAGDVTLTIIGSHDIVIDGDVTGGSLATVSATTGGGGKIYEYAPNAGTLSGALVKLTTTGGDIGSAGPPANPILVATAHVTTATNGTGNVYVSDSVAGTIDTGAGSVNDLNFTVTLPGGTLTVGPSGATASGNITYQETGAGGIISVNGNLNVAPTKEISLIAAGTITYTSGVLSGGTVSLTTGDGTTAGGSIGSGSAVQVQTPTLIVGTNAVTSPGGSVNVSDSVSGTITTSSKVGDLTFAVTNGEATIGSAGITSVGDVAISAQSSTTGNILIKGDVTTGTANTITLTAQSTPGGTGYIENTGSFTLTAGNVVLSSQTGSIGIVGGGPIAVSAANVKVSTADSASITDDQSATITTGAATLQSLTFKDTAPGGVLTVGAPGIITAATVNLEQTTAGGVINISNDIHSSGTVTLTTHAPSAGAGGVFEDYLGLGTTGTISANTVAIVTGGGDVGIGHGGAILVNGPAVTVTTSGTGNVAVNDAISGTISTAPSGSVLALTFKDAGSTLGIGTGGVVANGDVILQGTGASTSVSLDNAVGTTTGNQISVTATGAGTIEGAGTLTAGTVNLTTAGGAVGAVTPISVVASNVFADTTGSGNVSVTDSIDGAIGTGAGSVHALTFKDSGSLLSIATGGIQANTVTLTGTGVNTSVSLSDNVTAVGAGQVTATGTGTITEAIGALFTSSSLTAATGGGDIGSAAANGAIRTTTGAISASTNGTGAAYFSDSISGSFNATSTLSTAVVQETGIGQTLTIADLGAVTTTSDFVASATGAGSNVVLAGNIHATGVSAKIDLSTTGSGGISQTGGALTASTVALSTGSPTTAGGDIGPIAVVAPTVTVGTNATGTTTGSATISNTTPGASTIATTSSVNNLSYTAAGSATGLNAIDAKGNVTIMDAVGSNGDISINNNVNAAGTISLTTAGSGAITDSSGSQLIAPIVVLQSASGDIGTQANPVSLATPELATNSTAGSAWLANNQDLQLDASTAKAEFSLQNSGAVNIAGHLSVNAFSVTGRIDLNASGTITNSSNVTADSVLGPGGMIQFGALTSGSPLTVVNNGMIEAIDTAGASTTGIIAFNGGPSGTVSLTGTGSVLAGNYVAFGNIDPLTLVPIGGRTIANTDSFTGGLISFSQSSVVGNVGQIEVTVPLPPGPPVPPVVVVIPTPRGGGLGDFFFGVGGFGIPATTTASNILDQNNVANQANLAAQLAFAERLVQQLFFGSNSANPNLLPNNPFNTLNEQIGTRIATDYTPNTFPETRKFPDHLEGGIEIMQKLADIPGQAIFGATEFNSNELTALANQGVQFSNSSKDGFLDLLKGYVLFAPDKDVTVQLREGIVYIPKGCIAWVMETGADSAIYDLHDSLTTGAVRVVVNNKEIKMGPGTQMLLTRDMNASFDSLNPGGVVGYRNVRSTDMGGGIKSFIADFSIAHSLENLEVLHSLFYSKDSKHRKLIGQMLKNAAILADLTGGAGPFKTKP